MVLAGYTEFQPASWFGMLPCAPTHSPSLAGKTSSVHNGPREAACVHALICQQGSPALFSYAPCFCCMSFSLHQAGTKFRLCLSSLIVVLNDIQCCRRQIKMLCCGAGSNTQSVKALRALRALRPLRTITRFDSLRAIVVCFLEVNPDCYQAASDATAVGPLVTACNPLNRLVNAKQSKTNTIACGVIADCQTQVLDHCI